MALPYFSWKHLVLMTGVLFFAGRYCYAQNVPSSADPGRQSSPIEKRQDQFPDIKPFDPSVQRARAPDLSPETAQATFIFNSLTITGAQAFTPETLGSYYQRYLGQEITVSQLFDVLTDIQQLYQDHGYTISKVSMPEQNIKSGHIIFNVIEGYVGKVDIDPEIISSDLIDSFSQDVLAMRPLNTIRLERLMLILNDRPQLDVAAVISAADDQLPGAVKITLKPLNTNEPLTRYIGFDNHGSNFTGSGQVTAGGNFSQGLPNYSDLDLFLIQTTSAQEMRQAGAAYHLPVFGISGAMLNISSNMTRTEPGDTLDVLDVQGKSTSITAALSYPLIRQREEAWIVSAGLSYKNVLTNILQDRLFDDRTRSLFIDTKYSFSDRYLGLNAFQASYHQGFNILGARETGSIDLSREAGRSDFRKVEISASRLQQLTGSFDLLGRVKGQYAWNPLLSSEEFGFGGSDLGRGYDPSELTGDKGVSASLELRYRNNLNFQGQRPWVYQLYGFYDIGKVWNIDPGSKNTVSGASAGLGARLWINDDYQFDLNLSAPLTNPADNPPQYANGSSPRALLSFKYQF